MLGYWRADGVFDLANHSEHLLCCWGYVLLLLLLLFLSSLQFADHFYVNKLDRIIRTTFSTLADRGHTSVLARLGNHLQDSSC